MTYRVRVTAAGSKTPVLFDSGSYAQANVVRSMYLLLDHFGPGGEALRVADVNFLGAQDFPNETLASALRVANMIPTVAAVDVYLGDTSGTPIVANAPYGVTTAYVPVTNGATTLTITPAGDPATALTSGAITVTGGQARTVYTSQQAPLAPTFAGVIESQRGIAGQAQLRLVAASPDRGQCRHLCAGARPTDLGYDPDARQCAAARKYVDEPDSRNVRRDRDAFGFDGAAARSRTHFG